MQCGKPIQKEQLGDLLPAIYKIKDESMQQIVLDMWKAFYEKGDWKDLKEAYFISACPAYSLIQHTNYVTEAAIQIAQVTEQMLGMKIQWDVLIASCLLHDVSKLVETVMDEEGAHENEIGRQFQHGFLSASYAYEHGMPNEVVTNLITHTGDSNRIPTNIEGIILYYVDMIDTDLHFFEIGKELCIADQK